MDLTLTTLGYEDVPAPYSHAPTHTWNREYSAPLCGAKASVANCAQDATKVTCADCKRLLSPKDMAAQVDSLIARVLGLEGKVRDIERTANRPAEWQRNERDAQAMGEEIAKLVTERNTAQLALQQSEAEFRRVCAERDAAVRRLAEVEPKEALEAHSELDRAGVLAANEAGGFPLLHRVRECVKQRDSARLERCPGSEDEWCPDAQRVIEGLEAQVEQHKEFTRRICAAAGFTGSEPVPVAEIEHVVEAARVSLAEVTADRDRERATRTAAVEVINAARKAGGVPEGEPLTKAVERLVRERDEAQRALSGRDAGWAKSLADAINERDTIRSECDALEGMIEHLTSCNHALTEERDHLRASMSAIGKGLIGRKRDPVESYAAGTVPGSTPVPTPARPPCPSPGHCISCSTPEAPSKPKACEGCVNHRRDGNDHDTCMVWPPHLRPEPARCSTYQAMPEVKP